MKIGFDAKRLFHNFRGLGNYSRTLVEGLEFYYPDNEYFLYTPKIDDERAKDWTKKHPSLKVIEPKSFLSKKFSTAWRSIFLSQIIKQYDLDLYHGLSHELPPQIENLDIKKIVTIHDLIYLRYPEFFPLIDRKVYHKKFSYSISVADCIVAVCEQTKSDIIEYFNVPESKIKVVYQSCNQRFYNQLSSEKLSSIASHYNLPQDYLLYVGAIEKNKNTLSIVKSLKAIKDQDVSLVIVGNGKSYLNLVKDEVKKLGLEKRVLFLNNVKNEDLPGIYQLARTFVFPSFFEGFGIPIIESLFSETPVITSKFSSMPEAAGPGALLIDPNNIDELIAAIDELNEDEAKRRDLAHKGRAYVEKFHRHNTTKNMMDLYSWVISQL